MPEPPFLSQNRKLIIPFQSNSFNSDRHISSPKLGNEKNGHIFISNKTNTNRHYKITGKLQTATFALLKQFTRLGATINFGWRYNELLGLPNLDKVCLLHENISTSNAQFSYSAKNKRSSFFSLSNVQGSIAFWSVCAYHVHTVQYRRRGISMQNTIRNENIHRKSLRLKVDSSKW